MATLLKGDFEGLLGKRITGVVGMRGKSPEWVLWLLFDDGTGFELFGDGYVKGSKPEIMDAEGARRYHTGHEIVLDVQRC